MTVDEMVGWHHQLDGREFKQALGVGDGQGRFFTLHHVGSPGGSTGVKETDD